MSTKMKVGFLVLVLILAMPFILACDDGGPQPESLIMERSTIEQTIIDHVQENCSQDPECASHQLP